MNQLFGRFGLSVWNPARQGFASAVVIAVGSLLSACSRTQTERSLLTPASEACALDGAAARGSVWAPTCRGCHDIAASRPAQSAGGPNLHDVYESPAGTVSLKYAYKYSAAIQAARRAGLVWTADNLDQYLKSPRAFLERFTGEHFPPTANVMNFFVGGDGAAQERARRDIIAYLRAIKNRPCS